MKFIHDDAHITAIIFNAVMSMCTGQCHVTFDAMSVKCLFEVILVRYMSISLRAATCAVVFVRWIDESFRR